MKRTSMPMITGLTCAFALVAVATFVGADASADDPRKVSVYSLPNRSDLPAYGSGLAHDHGNKFWMVTDANILDNPVRLVQVKLHGQTLGEILDELVLTENGVTLTGRMIDLEDVSVAPDGSFWSCDESRPWLAHITRQGELTRIDTPANLHARVNNQGLEGCTLNEDGTKLLAILQSGLSTEPDKLNTILLSYDIANGTFRQYKYRLDDPAGEPYAPGLTPRMGANAITPVGHNEFYVLERDNISVSNGGLVKRVYRIELPDVPTSQPLTKTLVVDMVSLGYVLEQPEGIAVRPNRLYVVNDGTIAIPPEVWELTF